MRPRANTLGEFPAPPPAGSHVPADPADAARAEEETEPTPLVTMKAPSQKRDPLDVVREAIGELEYFDGANLAAAICAAALALGLGARAVIIHALDAKKNEVRIVAAKGPQETELIGARVLVQDDVVASTVVDSGRPMTLVIDPNTGLPRHAPDRLRAVGATRAVVAVPALVKKRVVAIIEVVDAAEGAATAVEPAAEYAGIQLARFLVTKRAARAEA